MCRKSLCHKRQPNSSGTFFMPSEQQPFPDFIENQKKDVTGILIISGQSTSTVSNSGTFIKYYKISQLIHTQSIAN